ncbi:MAG TPA: riboflavin synthase [Mycobacteriales bacterium]|nr:riboflavin synthase [Mycobacteriales bacterium]
MFTGIVEEIGELRALEQRGDSARLTLSGPLVAADASPGESIAVCGVCLTVVEVADGTFRADVMAQTLRHSTLGRLRPGDPVNLERALRVSDRLGGHIVQGHVDWTARVLDVRPAKHWTVVRLSLPAALARYVVAQGSIALDGVSLTVSALGADDDGDYLEVSLIPTTLAGTTFGGIQVGALVNVEVDVLAKYVERLLAAAPPTSLTPETGGTR